VLGKVYEGLGEQQKLLQLLREDRDNDAENFDVQLKLAIALDRAGEVIEAIEVLQAALALNSDSLKAHRLIAVLYESQGESEQATVHHKRVIELENRDEEPESVEADSSDAEPQVTVVDEADDSDKKTASSEQERAA
jgi:tetratricopeptide (TPR) repeat protein